MGAAEWTDAVAGPAMEERGFSGSSWWDSKGATPRGVGAGAVERRGGCERAIEGTSPGRRGPYAKGCSFAMAGWNLTAKARDALGEEDGRLVEAEAAGLNGLRAAVGLGVLHQGPSIGRGIAGGQRVPWVKPWGRSVNGDRRDGLRKKWW